MTASKSDHKRDLWNSGCSLTLAHCDGALHVFGAALDNDSMTLLPFAFCLWLAGCPSSFLTLSIQVITNLILNTHWDCTFSRLERRSWAGSFTGQDRLEFYRVAAEGGGLERHKKKVVTCTSLEYRSTAWNGRMNVFCWNDAGLLLYYKSDILTVRAIGWLVQHVTSVLLAETM